MNFRSSKRCSARGSLVAVESGLPAPGPIQLSASTQGPSKTISPDTSAGRCTRRSGIPAASR
eukprot:9226061-Pyramimonas_sp.AAC.1